MWEVFLVLLMWMVGVVICRTKTSNLYYAYFPVTWNNGQWIPLLNDNSTGETLNGKCVHLHLLEIDW